MKSRDRKFDHAGSSVPSREGRSERRRVLDHTAAEGPARQQGDTGESRPPQRDRKRLRHAEARLAAARDRETKRARQHAKAHDRVKRLEAGVAALRRAAGLDVTRETVVQAFCLREKQLVAIARPSFIVLRNGRPAHSGSCPSCGARVVSLARAADASLTSAQSSSLSDDVPTAPDIDPGVGPGTGA